MTPELHAMLLSWLGTGDDAQKRHAVYRLSLPDAVGYEPPPAPEPYPPLMEQAGNFVGAMAGFVADGFRTVDEDEQARRLEICRDCEHYDIAQERCRKCGCYANLKARIASQHCPEERW